MNNNSNGKIQFNCELKSKQNDGIINIVKRKPYFFKKTLIFEYHFKYREDAFAFKIPKKYKKEYYLLGEVFSHASTLEDKEHTIKPNSQIDYYYRIVQLKE